MRIIRTQTLSPTTHLSANDSLWVYNGLDTMITYEVLEALLPQLNPVTQATYSFSCALQGPILEMNSRGILIDSDRRDEVLSSYRQDIDRLATQLNSIICDGIGWSFDIPKSRKNPWPSDDQLKTLFYSVLGLPPIKKRSAAGEMVPTVDRNALEKLEHHFYAEPIVRHLYALRELGKRVSFLNTEIDPDGRIRTSFNIAGTTTGRLASSYSDTGTGTNLQNVENRLRSVFVADPGYKFCNIDLEQGDSRGVGAIHWNLFRDARYLDACESGDLHTTVARGAFPLAWTGVLKDDKLLASAKFYREFSYRDAAKRLGHGTNYQGQADKMSRATHIPFSDVKAFQSAYLAQFPAFPLWWQWVEDQIKHTGKITTFMGRQRRFFGHYRDSATIREGIAYEPQSCTADIIDRGLLALWRANIVQLLLQVHDSILFQFPEELEDTIVPQALSLIEQPLTIAGDRPFLIPAEAKVGWNWSDDKDDPDSMRKFSDRSRPEVRTRRPGTSVLDRWVSRIH